VILSYPPPPLDEAGRSPPSPFGPSSGPSPRRLLLPRRQLAQLTFPANFSLNPVSSGSPPTLLLASTLASGGVSFSWRPLWSRSIPHHPMVSVFYPSFFYKVQQTSPLVCFAITPSTHSRRTQPSGAPNFCPIRQNETSFSPQAAPPVSPVCSRSENSFQLLADGGPPVFQS